MKRDTQMIKPNAIMRNYFWVKCCWPGNECAVLPLQHSTDVQKKPWKVLGRCPTSTLTSNAAHWLLMGASHAQAACRLYVSTACTTNITWGVLLLAALLQGVRRP